MFKKLSVSMIQLREISVDDLSTINKWRNNQELIGMLGSPFRFINQETDKKWFESYMATRATNVRCSIVEVETNSIVGLVNLTNIDWTNRSAEFSIMIGDASNQAKGYGREATREMLKHGFNNLNLHRIYLTVLQNNSRAIKLYQEVGFIQDGVIRDSVFKQGKYLHSILMSILQNEFRF